MPRWCWLIEDERIAVVNVESPIEPVDRQLILIHGVRRLLSEIAKRRRSPNFVACKPSTSRTNHRSRFRKIWLSLQYEFDFESLDKSSEAAVPEMEVASDAFPIQNHVTHTPAFKGASSLRPEPITGSRPPALGPHRALAGVIPSGPVVVKPADLARLREKKAAETPVRIEPAVKSGLDSLIEAAAARFGLKPMKLS